MNKRTFYITMLVIAFLCVILYTNSSLWAGPMKFATPEAASAKLISSLKANSSEQLDVIFGENPSKLLPFLDEDSAKRNYNLQLFIKTYEEHHYFQKDGKETILYAGKTGWPFFIPLIVDSAGKWTFDLQKGVVELKTRKIGKNELFVLDTLNAYVDGQREFFRNNHSKGLTRTYARKIFSDRGLYNGLYWRKEKGKSQSPLGPYLAWAEQRGRKGSRNRPYSGYYYKILTKQGKEAEGGAHSYIVNDKMIFGFALIAWPADYGTSGVMSFIVDHHDRVYEKDLGEDTANSANAIDSFNPDDSWSQVDSRWTD